MGLALKKSFEEIKQTLADHTEMHKVHAATDNEHGVMLREQGETLKGHGTILKEHGETLKGHGTMLKEHGETLKGHGTILKELADISKDIIHRLMILEEKMHEAGLREEERDDTLRAIFDVVTRQSVEREKVAELDTTVQDYEYRLRSVEAIVKKENES